MGPAFHSQASARDGLAKTHAYLPLLKTEDLQEQYTHKVFRQFCSTAGFALLDSLYNTVICLNLLCKMVLVQPVSIP
jgi:hypothetical protein